MRLERSGSLLNPRITNVTGCTVVCKLFSWWSWNFHSTYWCGKSFSLENTYFYWSTCICIFCLWNSVYLDGINSGGTLLQLFPWGNGPFTDIWRMPFLEYQINISCFAFLLDWHLPIVPLIRLNILFWALMASEYNLLLSVELALEM